MSDPPAYFCTSCQRVLPLETPCDHISIEPSALIRLRQLSDQAADRRVPLQNLVPVALHDVMHSDSIVYAVLLNCALRGTTREEALIECIKHLAKDRVRATEAFQDHLAHCSPVLAVKP